MKGRYGFVVILVAYALVRTFWLLTEGVVTTLGQAVLKSILWIPVCWAVTALANRQSTGAGWGELGLGGSPREGIIFGLVATMPMAVAILIDGLNPFRISVIASAAVIDPIAETILFTGFLSGQLFQRARWPLAASIAVSALMFGVAHLDGYEWQLTSLPTLAAIAAGGAVFTWVAHRWGSLWPAIALHGAINLWWTVSGEPSNIARPLGMQLTPVAAGHALSMAIAIAGTLWWTRRPRLRATYYFTRTV